MRFMISRLFILLMTAQLAAAAEQTLEDWQAFPSATAKTNLATARRGADGWLELQVQKGAGRAGIELEPAAGTWDLTAFAEIAVPVRNLTSRNLRVILRVDDDHSRNLQTVQHKGGYFEALLSPGHESAWLVVPLSDGKTSPLAEKFLSMVGKPCEFVRRGIVQGGAVTRVSVFVPDPEAEQALSIGPVVARGVPAPLRDWSEARTFPFVDEYGQYLHRDWPRKIHSDTDFVERRQAENADLDANPRPKDWDRYGGWTGGPKLQATGWFRVEKQNDAWWLVDPDGHLFWSHGVVRVGTRIRVGGIYRGTPLPDRETFMQLPPKDSPLGAFYGTQPQATRGYYVGRDNHAIYDYLEANLFRKYGPQWPAEYARQAQLRLASWALNSIANSSDPAIYLQQQTPYTAIVYSAPLGRSEFRIEGSTGAWGKLPDPFDPAWREQMNRTLQSELKASVNDPWCLGFFVDNELHWGDTCHLAEATLASPANQPAKQRFVAWLREKYSTPSALNANWGTQHASWNDVLASTLLPDRKKARTDLEAFSEQILDAYFRGCREAVKAAAPNHLYLGCRFAGWGNAMVMRTAARYCDVVSVNRYTRTVADLALPDGLDRPILIGEFHFDAMDSPMHPAGLVLVANQADRARSYRTYVRSALENPAVVGTHWFQFYDQPTTGRFDGENYQTGLVDIADTPYSETIAACREMGRNLYRIRSARAAASRP